MSVLKTNVIHTGDALAVLRTLPSSSINCVMTSPPYWNLRDYKADGQLGLEPTPQEYIARLTAIFGEARRVLRDDGVMFVNIGDSYSGAGKDGGTKSKEGSAKRAARMFSGSQRRGSGIAPKSLVGIPARLQIALIDDGWVCRNSIIWHKPNCMPTSAKDRLTNAYEFVYLFTKTGDYWYDADAVRETAIGGTGGDFSPKYAAAQPEHGRRKQDDLGKRQYTGFNSRWAARDDVPDTRNGRDVWTIPTEPSTIEHFAMMPSELARRCITAGCPAGGTVLDPFFGTGTTGYVAQRHGRQWIGIELNEEFAAIARSRVDMPYVLPMLFADAAPEAG